MREIPKQPLDAESAPRRFHYLTTLNNCAVQPPPLTSSSLSLFFFVSSPKMVINFFFLREVRKARVTIRLMMFEGALTGVAYLMLDEMVTSFGRVCTSWLLTNEEFLRVMDAPMNN